MQYEDTRAAMEFAGLTVYGTWMHYCNMGGLTDYFDFDAYLHGIHPLESEDADIVSQAVNELIDDACTGDDALLCRAPYSWTRERGTFHSSAFRPSASYTDDDPDGFDDGAPIRVPVDDLVKPHPAETFGSRTLTGLDVSALLGRPGVPLPPGAPVELLGEILDSGVLGRIFSIRRS